MVRVEHAMKYFDLVEVEMDPGDALFFHCNLLHASGKNNSDQTRNVLLSCYNRADNPPFMESPGNGHTLFETLPDSEVMAYSDRPLDHNKIFMTAASGKIKRMRCLPGLLQKLRCAGIPVAYAWWPWALSLSLNCPIKCSIIDANA